MNKKTNVDFGFLLLREWLPVLEMLSAREFKTLVLGMMYKQFENRPMPEFRNAATSNIARLLEPTIERRLIGAAWAKKGLEAKGTPMGEGEGEPIHLAEQSEAKQSVAEHILAERREAEQKEGPCPAAVPAPSGSALPSGARRALSEEEMGLLVEENIPEAYLRERQERAFDFAYKTGQDVLTVLATWWKRDKAAFVGAHRQARPSDADLEIEDFYRAALARSYGSADP